MTFYSSSINSTLDILEHEYFLSNLATLAILTFLMCYYFNTTFGCLHFLPPEFGLLDFLFPLFPEIDFGFDVDLQLETLSKYDYFPEFTTPSA